MSKARAILGLQVLVAALGAAATALALFVALSAVTLPLPSAAALLAACRGFVLPQLRLGSVLALALGSVAFAVLGLAARSARRQAVASRRFIAALDVVGPASPGALLFADSRPLAFCAGLLRPQVYLSTGALDALGDEELEAVLAHEAHHARYRDPLRIFFARMLSDSLFFLSVLRRLADRYAAWPSWRPTPRRCAVTPAMPGPWPRRCWPSMSVPARPSSASRPNASTS